MPELSDIFEASLPTDQEMITIAQRWWSELKGVTFLDWNEVLLKHSFPLEMVKMPPEHISKLYSPFESSDILQVCESLINPLLEKLNCKNSFFLKLISRSPKDGMKSFELKTVTEAVEAIASSMRCADDLCLLKYLDMAYLIVRPFVRFDKRQEWRVFVKDGEIKGISQYWYQEIFDISPMQSTLIQREIIGFVNDIVIPNMQVEDFVADVIIKGNNNDTVLLETNPYGLSDPCLFESYEAIETGCNTPFKRK